MSSWRCFKLSLNDFLQAEQDSQIPAVQYLIDLVKTVLEDNRISEQEREYLQRSIETVLPREERDIAVLRRRERVADQKRIKAEQKARQTEIERNSRPILTFDFMVAGVTHEGRGEIVELFAEDGDPVALIRDHGNKHSRNAIEVRLKNNEQIGYVPENEAARIAKLLDDGGKQSAEIKKILRGRRTPIPVVWGEIYSKDCPLTDVWTQAQVLERAGLHPKETQIAKPAQSTPAASDDPAGADRSIGCAIKGLLTVVIILIILAILVRC